MGEPGGRIGIIVDGDHVAVESGKPLLNQLLREDLLVSTACGGHGVCHLCRVEIQNRELLPPPTKIEKRALGNVLLALGMRLSCQITAVAGLKMKLPKVESAQERRERVRKARERRRKRESS